MNNNIPIAEKRKSGTESGTSGEPDQVDGSGSANQVANQPLEVAPAEAGTDVQAAVLVIDGEANSSKRQRLLALIGQDAGGSEEGLTAVANFRHREENLAENLRPAYTDACYAKILSAQTSREQVWIS